MSCLSHRPWLDHSNYNLRKVRVMKLLTVQFSSSSCHFISLLTKYSPKHPVRKHSQSTVLPQCQGPCFKTNTDLLTASSKNLLLNINKIIRTATIITLLMQNILEVRREQIQETMMFVNIFRNVGCLVWCVCLSTAISVNRVSYNNSLNLSGSVCTTRFSIIQFCIMPTQCIFGSYTQQRFSPSGIDCWFL
jgi:hypothetical protein